MRQLFRQGDVFGRLTLVERVAGTRRPIKWTCSCECGASVVVAPGLLRSGNTRSCGCLRKELSAAAHTTHGAAHTRTYSIWAGVVQRCTNPNNHRWPHYGGRGITVCDRWLSSSNFLEDMGQAPDGMSIERIDNELGYFKENCRWATQKEQCRNTRRTRLIEYNGETLSLAALSERTGTRYSLIRDRLNRGWPVERAVQS